MKNIKENRTLVWHIGKLKKEEEIIIEYFVEIKRGIFGQVILSVGKVANKPSSTVRNIIGKGLDKYEQIHIKNIYEKLKSNYIGINLINTIYNESFNIDLGLNEFNFEN